MMKMEPRTSFLKKFCFYLMACYLQGAILLGVFAGLQKEKVSCFLPSLAVCALCPQKERNRYNMYVGTWG